MGTLTVEFLLLIKEIIVIVKELRELIESKPDLSKSVLIQDEDGNVIDNVYFAFDLKIRTFYIKDYIEGMTIADLLYYIKYFDLSEFKVCIRLSEKLEEIEPFAYFDTFDIIFDINGNLNFVVK